MALSLWRISRSKLARSLSTSLPSLAAGRVEEHSRSFGYEEVSDKERRVRGVFDSVASSYDVMNDVMSAGVHRLWKDHFVRVLNPSPSDVVLDLAGGTGDIAFRILQHMRETPGGQTGRVVVCDINDNMLRVGRQRAAAAGLKEEQISWLQGNAEHLPLSNNSVHACTIAFGIRNVTYIDKVLREAHRVLIPGGRFLCLEFSEVKNVLLRSVYDAYSFQIIPIMGEIFARDRASYQYLVESIRRFPTQEPFADMMREAGFRHVAFENLMNGVAAVHSGFKLP